MDAERTRDEFERIALHQHIEKTKMIINQYRDGLAHRRQLIADAMYELGRLDERLEDAR